MKKKVLTLFLASIVLSTTVGCNFNLSFGKPKNAEALHKKYVKATESVENCRMTGDMELKVSTEVDGATTSLPINVNIDSAMNKDGDNYTKTDLSVTLLGVDVEVNAETYVDVDGKDITTYTKTDSSDWIVDSSKNVSSNFLNIDDLKFTEGEFTEEENSYNVSIDTSNIDSDIFSSLLSNLDYDVDINSDDFKSGKYILKFDKETYLLSGAEIKDLSLKVNVTEDEQATMTINTNFEYTDYNNLSEDDYTVPSEVKSSAKEKGSADDLSDALNDVLDTEESVVIDEYNEETVFEEEYGTESDGMELLDIDGNVLCNVTLPDGFNITDKSETSIAFTGPSNWHYIVSTYPDAWVSEMLENGSIVLNENDYATDSAFELESFESPYGTVHIYERTYAYKDESNLTYAEYAIVLDKGTYSPSIVFKHDYIVDDNIDLSQFARTLFQ